MQQYIGAPMYIKISPYIHSLVISVFFFFFYPSSLTVVVAKNGLKAQNAKPKLVLLRPHLTGLIQQEKQLCDLVV